MTMDSILYSIKQLLGIDVTYRAFDEEIIMHINSALMVLTQLGVGPKDGFKITGPNETWNDFLGEYEPKFKGVRSYVHAKVRLMWDTAGLNGSVLDAIQRTVQEFEWRLNVRSEEVKTNA